MTLRITLSIIPFGDEAEARVIETINVSNLTSAEKSQYVIERNTYKQYDDATPRVWHYRPDGALRLVQKVLNRLLDE